MTKENIRIEFFIILVLFLLLPIAVIPSRGDVIPVVPLNGESTTFSPTVSGNSSYYLVQPGFNGSNIIYSGKSSDFTYTTNGANTLSSNSGTATNGHNMPSEALTPDTISSSNPSMLVISSNK